HGAPARARFARLTDVTLGRIKRRLRRPQTGTGAEDLVGGLGDEIRVQLPVLAEEVGEGLPADRQNVSGLGEMLRRDPLQLPGLELGDPLREGVPLGLRLTKLSPVPGSLTVKLATSVFGA